MRRWLIAVVLIAACKKQQPPPPPPASPTPSVSSVPVESAATREQHSLLRYEAFSADGLVFVYATLETSGPKLQWLSATTNTVEKTMPLSTNEQKQAALAALKEEGFPQVGTISLVPSQVNAELRQGQVQVTFGPMPGTRPFKPFADQKGVTATETQVVAVTKDGKRAAVKTTGQGADAGAQLTEYRVVSLFE